MKGIHEKIYTAWKAGKPPSPAIGTLGIKVRHIEEAHSILELDVDEHLHNLSGTMHGGVMGVRTNLLYLRLACLIPL